MKKKMGGIVRIENILGGKYTKETVVRGELSIYSCKEILFTSIYNKTIRR